MAVEILTFRLNSITFKVFQVNLLSWGSSVSRVCAISSSGIGSSSGLGSSGRFFSSLSKNSLFACTPGSQFGFESGLRELLSDDGAISLLLFNLNIIRADSKLETELLGFSSSRSHENGVDMNWDALGLLLCKLNSDRGRPVSNEVLQLAAGYVGIHKLEYVVLIRLLGELDGDRGRPVGDEVLQLATRNISIHELENVVLIGFLSQFDGDGARSVGDKVFQLSTANVSIHKLEDVVLVGFLGKLDSDRGWSISHQVFQLASGDVGIH